MKKILGSFVMLLVLVLVYGLEANAKDVNLRLDAVYSNQKATNLSSFIGERPLLVIFFYPQCPTCEKESEAVNKIYKKYKNSIYVIGISLSRDKYDIEDFVDDFNIKYPVYRIVKKDELRNIGGILATPTSMIIDKNGKIVKKIPGVVGFKFLSNKIGNTLSK